MAAFDLGSTLSRARERQSAAEPPWTREQHDEGKLRSQTTSERLLHARRTESSLAILNRVRFTKYVPPLRCLWTSSTSVADKVCSTVSRLAAGSWGVVGRMGQAKSDLVQTQTIRDTCSPGSARPSSLDLPPLNPSAQGESRQPSTLASGEPSGRLGEFSVLWSAHWTGPQKKH